MLTIDYALCAGCGACAEQYPLLFEMKDDKAWIRDYTQFREEEYRNDPVICPYRAIILE